MTITQTVEIPADRRLIIDVPYEIPAGQVILTFTSPSSEAVVAPSPVRKKMTEAEEIEYINRNAESLNREAEDVLLYQDIDGFEEDFERLAPLDSAIMRDTTVPFSLADIVFDRDDKRLKPASGETHPV